VISFTNLSETFLSFRKIKWDIIIIAQMSWRIIHGILFRF
jgi:hypothetical protein